VDWGLLFGSMATFGVLFLLFLRFLPVVPVAEVKELRRELEHEEALAAGGHRPHAAEARP
jgi:molybdopterin-containing oxidoreductase family membrane subunit